MSIVDVAPPAAMPYADRESLVALTYRMPTMHRAPRTLVLLPHYWGEFSAGGWDGEVVVRKYPLDRPDEFAAASFHRVAMHWVLDEVGRGCGRRQSREREIELLLEVRRMIVPGGWVVGLAANWLCLGEREGRPVFGRTPSSCTQLLRRAGFNEPGMSIAMPSGDFPRHLVSIAPIAARHFFRRQLALTQDEDNARFTALRQLMVETGVIRYLQGSLVFSGRVPC